MGINRLRKKMCLRPFIWDVSNCIQWVSDICLTWSGIQFIRTPNWQAKNITVGEFLRVWIKNTDQGLTSGVDTLLRKSYLPWVSKWVRLICPAWSVNSCIRHNMVYQTVANLLERCLGLKEIVCFLYETRDIYTCLWWITQFLEKKIIIQKRI